MRRSLLKQPIDSYEMQELVYLVRAALINKNQLKIVTLNPEMIAKSTKDFEFQAAVNNAHFVVPDGTGIVWAFKYLNGANISRIPGIELSEHMLEIADNLEKKVAIFGSTKQALDKAVLNLKKKYSKLNIVSAIDGYQGIENDEKIAHDTAKHSPDLVLVALGSPRQEVWINKYASLFPESILIGIGGSLDVWSGKIKRAPQWVRDAHLEWLFRACIKPTRATRILNSLPRFMLMVLSAKLSLQTKLDF